MLFISLLILSFLMGSVPFGLLFSGAWGVDPRKTGSGNIGATNVLRAAGKAPAILTLLCDLLKGTAAVALGRAFGLGALEEGLLGLSAVVGHDFSIFLGLKGGKGVATSLGVLLIYAPLEGVAALLIWLVTVLLTRYSSLGAIVSFSLLPFVFLLLGHTGAMFAVALMLSALLILKHAGNIKRLLTGTERRIGESA